MKQTDIDFSTIDWNLNNAGEWSTSIKTLVIAFISLFIFTLGIFYDTLSLLNALESAEKKEIDLRARFELKHNQSANLPEYQEQLKLIKQKLREMIQQMPLEEEIAGLLIDISQTGVASGLEFKLFKPAPPIRQDFYSELPINIEVVGKYDDLCLFISGLAALPRIVTIHDLTITPVDKISVNKQSAMLMAVTIKTYKENKDSQNEAK
jgi:type IV pilus assembly protein PilO